MKKINLDIDYIKTNYLEGKTILQIAEEMNVNPYTIANRLRSINLDIRDNSLDLNDEYIKSSYLNGKAYHAIAMELGVSKKVIKKRLKKYGISIRHNNYLDLDVEYIKQSYLNGKSCTEIAREFGVGTQVISERLKSLGIKINKNNMIDLDVNYIKKSYLDGKTAKVIAKELNVNVEVINLRLNRAGVKNKKEREDLTGRTFNMLTVLKWTNNQWECSCKCGNVCFALGARLKSGKKKSCGCLRKNRDDRKTGCGDITGSHWSGIRYNAKSRGLEFEISVEESWQLFLLQNRKCKLTGLNLEFNEKNATASLDRIDNSKGYISGNVQWLHKDINFIKQSFEQNYFIYLCKLVARENI